MVRIVLENQWNIFNDGLTFLADVLPQTMSLFTVMTRTAQMSGGQNYICWIWISTSHSCLHSVPYCLIWDSPACVLHKAHVCENGLAEITAETVGVPAEVHGLYHTANDELACEQDQSHKRITRRCWNDGGSQVRYSGLCLSCVWLLTTLVTAGSEQHLEVMLAVFSAFKLRKQEQDHASLVRKTPGSYSTDSWLCLRHDFKTLGLWKHRSYVDYCSVAHIIINVINNKSECCHFFHVPGCVNNKKKKHFIKSHLLRVFQVFLHSSPSFQLKWLTSKQNMFSVNG